MSNGVWNNAKDNKHTTYYESNATNDFFKPEPGPAMKEVDSKREISDWPTAADNWSNKMGRDK